MFHTLRGRTPPSQMLDVCLCNHWKLAAGGVGARKVWNTVVNTMFQTLRAPTPPAHVDHIFLLNFGNANGLDAREVWNTVVATMLKKIRVSVSSLGPYMPRHRCRHRVQVARSPL